MRIIKYFDFKKIAFVALLLFSGAFAIGAPRVQANEAEHGTEHHEHSSHQHGTTQEKAGHHDHSQDFMGVGFGLLSGALTLTSLLTTFIIGMLRRFGKKKMNMNLHHYAAYTTVALAFIHGIYNLVTHL